MTPSDSPFDAEEQQKSECGKTQHDAKEEHPNTSTNKALKEFFKGHPQVFSAIFAGCALLVSIIACVFSYMQMENSGISAEAARQSALSAKESIEIAKKAMRVSNRPYIVVNGSQFVFEDWNNVFLVVKTKNSGKTPAQITRIATKINCYPTDFIEAPAYDTLAVDTIKTFIPLGSETPFAINLRSKGKFTADQIAKLTNGELFLFAYGKIEYTDIFGDSLITKFNFQYIRESFKVHRKHNEIK